MMNVALVKPFWKRGSQQNCQQFKPLDMKLQFHETTTLRDLKDQFQTLFPCLKLEFFREDHEKGKGSRLQDRLPDEVRVSDLNEDLGEGLFFFTPEFTVSYFEQAMQNEFGLPVQVFRKSGNVWLETIHTDHLSLKKQNLMAEASGKPVRMNFYSLFL